MKNESNTRVVWGVFPHAERGKETGRGYEAPQRCKVCGKDSIRVICDSEDCSLEFYSAEYQEWPEDEEEAELGTDEGEEYY